MCVCAATVRDIITWCRVSGRLLTSSHELARQAMGSAITHHSSEAVVIASVIKPPTVCDAWAARVRATISLSAHAPGVCVLVTRRGLCRHSRVCNPPCAADVGRTFQGTLTSELTPANSTGQLLLARSLVATNPGAAIKVS